MDIVKTSCYCIVLLLCCQYGVSYRVYILPEPGAFCLGVFSGDDCITWSDYSVNPTFVYHSTTLIFTPGNYTRSSRFSVANIKTFTMIGDSAQLQFQLSLSNILDTSEYVTYLFWKLVAVMDLMFTMSLTS